MRSTTRLLRRFGDDQRGAIAIIFALTIVVLVGSAGLAVDYARAYSVSSKLRSAADAAALAGAKLLSNEALSDSQIKAAAKSYFQAQLDAIGMGGVTATPLDIELNRSQSEVSVSSDISMATMFGGVVNVPTFDFDVESTVVYNNKKIELALVLDVTGSMDNNGRMAAMKTAAKNIVDTMINDQDGKNNRMSLVPYSGAVNLGSAYSSQVSGGSSVDGCVIERLSSGNRDTDEASGGLNDFAVKGQLNSTESGRYGCPSPVMMPLSKNADALKSMVDTYTAGGWTAGHIGLAWGWNTISPKWNGVFTGESKPAPYDDDKYVKAVILMTDGSFNTAYTAGTSENAMKEESRSRTLALCDNMKVQKVKIYSVAFEAPADAQTLLQSCASSAANYFNAADSTQLNAAFQKIADNLHSMRLAK